MSSVVLFTRSGGETRAAGALLAAALRPGDVVLLCGDLGAGKTTMVQGIGDAFGVGEPMTSPTFTLVRTYATRPVLAHADVWRLCHLREVLDLGLDELLDEGAIGLVEWGDAVADALGRDALVVRLEPVAGEPETVRRITIEARGSSVAARLDAVATELAPAGGVAVGAELAPAERR